MSGWITLHLSKHATIDMLADKITTLASNRYLPDEVAAFEKLYTDRGTKPPVYEFTTTVHLVGGETIVVLEEMSLIQRMISNRLEAVY